MGLKIADVIRKGLNVLPGVELKSELVSDLGNPAAWLTDFFGGGRVLSGENVTFNTAMELTSFYAGLRNISEDIAKLPVNIFKIIKRGKTKQNTHPLFSLLNSQVNPYCSSTSFYQTLIHWAIGAGNGYAEIVKNSLGQPVEMWPIHPSRVTPFFKSDMTLHYRITARNTIQGQTFDFVELSAENVYNLVGLGGDGIVGYSLYQILAQSIGVGLATQNCAASYYGNGTTLSGVLENPGKLSKEAYARMRSSWDKLHSGGAANKNKVAILEEATKFNPTTSDASNAQLIESRKFTVLEVARAVRMPPHKLGSTEKMTLNNLESQNSEYNTDTLAPWINRIKDETNRKLLKNPSIFAEHEIRALTLGDSKTRAGVWKTHRNMGTMSINDVRDQENMNAIDEDWADEYHMQMNITTVEAISDKANLKPNGQNGATKMESGEKDPEGRDPESTQVEPEMNLLEKFEEAKADHLPSFVFAAQRVLSKESKQLQSHLSSDRQNLKGFTGWAEFFFSKQKNEIIDAFKPCSQVFINTFKLEIDSNFLVEFADTYAADGQSKAVEMWNKQAKDEILSENVNQDEEKLANSVINLIVSKAKEAQDEDL